MVGPVVAGASASPTVAAIENPDATDGVTATPAPTTAVDLTTARPNSEVAVLVVNGTAVSGQASRLTSQLQNQGFVTREPKNTTSQPASVIYYRPGFAAEATVIRNVLGQDTPIAPMPEPDPFLGDDIDLAPVNVLVLVGADELSTS